MSKSKKMCFNFETNDYLVCAVQCAEPNLKEVMKRTFSNGKCALSFSLSIMA